MTNTPPGNAVPTPVNARGEEQGAADASQARPTAAKVTPSQQGQFQGALERKTGQDEKGTKKTSSGGTPAKKTGKGGGVFQLASGRTVEGEEAATTNVGTDGESAGEGEGDFLPKKKTPTTPSAEQVAAAGQAAAASQVQSSTPAAPTAPVQTKTSSTTSVGGTAASAASPQTASSETLIAPTASPAALTGPSETPKQLAPAAYGETTITGPEAATKKSATATPAAVKKAVPDSSAAAATDTPEKTAEAPAPQAAAKPAPTADSTSQAATAPVQEKRPDAQKTVGGTKPVSEKKAVAETVPQAPVQKAVAAASTPAAQTDTAAEAVRSRREALFQLISQAAEAIATFVSKDVTSTVVTIKQPPIFDGATLTVTEHTSAPQQFNITFENLSPSAHSSAGCWTSRNCLQSTSAH